MRRRFAFLAQKNLVIAFTMAALIGLTVLAAGLRQLEFSPPQRIGLDAPGPVEFSSDRMIREIVEIPVWRQIAFWGLFVILILLITSLLSPELRKRMLRAFIRIASFIFILLFVIQNNPRLIENLMIGSQPQGAIDSASAATDLPPAVFQPPEISPLISYLASFSLVICLLGVLWGISRWWIRKQKLRADRKPLDEIAVIARASLDEMAGNRDWGDAIIRCYGRMSRVVARQLGTQRETSMTPAEFATHMEHIGMPREAIHRLTHLFESVRYGGRRARQVEIDEAVASLKTILEFCGEPV